MGMSNALLDESSSSLETINTAIGEVASRVQSSAQAATEGATQSSTVSTGTTEGVHSVGQIVEGMKRVDEKSDETMELIGRLVQSVDAISLMAVLMVSREEELSSSSAFDLPPGPRRCDLPV